MATLFQILLLLLLYQANPVQGVVVKSGSNDAIGQVELELRNVTTTRTAPLFSATTANGRFIFRNVPAGRYRLFATRNGFTSGNGVPVIVAQGQPTPAIRVEMVATGTISGRIMSRLGGPLQRANVQAVKITYPEGKLTATPVRTVITDDLGEYRLFWLPPGRYYVNVLPINLQTIGATILNNPGGSDILGSFMVVNRPRATTLRPAELEENETYLPTYFPGTADVQSATMLDVRPGEEIRDVNLLVVGAKTVRIRATVSDGPPSTIIRLTPFVAGSPARPRQQQPVNDAVTFDGLTPGKYEVRAFSPNSDRVGRAIVDVYDRDVDVNLTMNSIRVTGRIRVEGGTLDLRNGQVFLKSPPGFEVNGPILPDGTFMVGGIALGDYQVNVSAALLQDAYLKSAPELRISEQPREPMEIVLSRNGGIIRGRTSTPNASVVLVPGYKNATSNDKGEFEIRAIAPGDYLIYSWREIETDSWQDPNLLRLYRERATPVRVMEGQSQTLQLTPLN